MLYAQGLSQECLELLSRLLDVDPEARIAVPEILRHPWFLQHLPPKLAELNTQVMRLPLSLLEDRCKQSEQQIAQLASLAMKVARA